MLYTALNLTTDEIFASNSFKTVYEAVMTNLTYSYTLPSALTDKWSIKKHSNLDADNFSFQDVIFDGEEIYRVHPTRYAIVVQRRADNTTFYFRARYNRRGNNHDT